MAWTRKTAQAVLRDTQQQAAQAADSSSRLGQARAQQLQQKAASIRSWLDRHPK